MFRPSKLLAAGAAAIAFAIPTIVYADDYRADFPPQYAETPLGVNLQTGRFTYWLYSFQMGPFATQRGFGKSGLPFLGRLYWTTIQTATGAGQPIVRVYLNDGGHGAVWTLEFCLSSNSPNYIWWNTSSVGYRLARGGGGYTLTTPNGDTYFFADAGGAYPNPDGRLTKVTYADGASIDLSYDGAGSLTLLTSSSGYAMRFEQLLGGAQAKICGFNQAQAYVTSSTPCTASNYVVTLNGTVNQSGKLQVNSVTDVLGQTSTVSYINGFIQCVTLPNSSTCEVTNTYGPQPGEVPQETKADQVRIQVDANGNTYNYGYSFPYTNTDDPPRLPGGPPVISASWMNGPTYSAQIDYENGLATQVSAPGNGPVWYEYEAMSEGLH